MTPSAPCPDCGAAMQDRGDGLECPACPHVQGWEPAAAPMPHYYDRAGAPMELMAWADRFEDHPYRVIAQNRVGEDDSVLISTVWLGLNHRFGDGPPLIFETMVFGGLHDEAQYRYATEAAAQAGHARILAACEAGTPLPDTLPEITP